MSAKSIKQRCFLCLKKPVKPIKMRGGQSTNFCSTLCAVAAADDQAVEDDLVWCSVCGAYVFECEHEGAP